MRYRVVLGMLATIAVGVALYTSVFAGTHQIAAGSALLAGSARPALQETHRLNVQGYINAVAWNFDGSRLAAISDFGSKITLFDAKTWSVINRFENSGTSYMFNSLAFLSDGSLLTTPPPKHFRWQPDFNKFPIYSLLQWNPETGQIIRHVPEPGILPDVVPNIFITETYAVSKDGLLIAGAGE